MPHSILFADVRLLLIRSIGCKLTVQYEVQVKLVAPSIHWLGTATIACCMQEPLPIASSLLA